MIEYLPLDGAKLVQVASYLKKLLKERRNMKEASFIIDSATSGAVKTREAITINQQSRKLRYSAEAKQNFDILYQKLIKNKNTNG
jgi:hypothetical protein